MRIAWAVFTELLLIFTKICLEIDTSFEMFKNYDNHRLFFGSVLFYAVCKIARKAKLLDGSTVSGSD